MKEKIIDTLLAVLIFTCAYSVGCAIKTSSEHLATTLVEGDMSKRHLEAMLADEGRKAEVEFKRSMRRIQEWGEVAQKELQAQALSITNIPYPKPETIIRIIIEDNRTRVEYPEKYPPSFPYWSPTNIIMTNWIATNLVWSNMIECPVAALTNKWKRTDITLEELLKRHNQ